MSNVWPCDLLMVMAKATLTGNCFLVEEMPLRLSEGVNFMRGKKMVVSLRGPVATWTSRTWEWNSLTMHQVPLHTPEARLRMRMTVHPILSSSL